MPWLIDVNDVGDGQNGFVWGMQPFERIIERDHEEFAKRVGSVFPFEEDFSHLFDHAEYEYGRVYYRMKRARKTLPGRAKRYWYCDRFKRILEELEPGKHRFARVDIRMTDGKTAWPEPYWHWRCENFVDAIIPDIGDGDARRSSNIFWNAARQCLAATVDGISIGRPVPLTIPVLSINTIRNTHAWQENGLIFKHASDYIFLSDEFVDRLRHERAEKGLQLGHVNVSDLSAMSGRTSGEAQ